jgi:predicted transcriptional regulator
MKTVTMRVEDSVYSIIKSVADGQKRNISNFIEFAVMQYVTSSQYIDNAEMSEIERDTELIENLKNSLLDVKNGDYEIV